MKNNRYIPLEVLFSRPEKHILALSPDGKMLSYFKYENEKETLIVCDLETGKEFTAVDNIDGNVLECRWAYNNKSILFEKDYNGNENFRLYEVNIDDLKLIEHTPFEHIFVKGIKMSKNLCDVIYFEMNKENPVNFDLYKLDLKTKEISIVERNNGSIAEWIMDEDFDIRGYVDVSKDGSLNVMLRSKESNEYKRMLVYEVEDSFSGRPLGFFGDVNCFYALNYTKEGILGLISIDTITSEIKLIYQDEKYDIDDIVINPLKGGIEAVSCIKYINEYAVIDSEVEDKYDFIKNSINSEFFIQSKSLNNDVWVVKAISNEGVISYYLYKKHKLEFLFDENHEFKNYKLSKHEFINYVSRDGLKIEGYITYPDTEKKEKLPLILNVHGGPWYRDKMEDLTKEAQWIANRGYICLNVNFRGSTGYGKDFLNKGNKEWGKSMHSDLLDAVNWAVENKIADEKRIAIFGMSYGGYATLAGITLTPDVFKCGVERVGPSNLINLLNSLPPNWQTFKANYLKRIGDPEKDKQMLMEVSPYYHLDNIKVPVLIAHGLNDPRVNYTESENVVEYLKKNNRPYEYMLFEDEGHFFTKQKNNYIFYKAAEEFFGRYL